MAKPVTITMKLRDEENNIIGNVQNSGTTEDEGLTVLLGLGYLPNVAAAAALGDVTVEVATTTLSTFEPVAAEAVADVENNMQTITFTLP
jgi:hypothetical protein